MLAPSSPAREWQSWNLIPGLSGPEVCALHLLRAHLIRSVLPLRLVSPGLLMPTSKSSSRGHSKSVWGDCSVFLTQGPLCLPRPKSSPPCCHLTPWPPDPHRQLPGADQWVVQSPIPGGRLLCSSPGRSSFPGQARRLREAESPVQGHTGRKV